MQLYEIKKYLLEGNDGKNSHMVVIDDRWDYTYDVRYVQYGSDINAIITSIESEPYRSIKEVYSYSLDLDSQLREYRAYHVKPIHKQKLINIDDVKKQVLDIDDGSLTKAIDFATEKHAGVSRINGLPYINHQLSVARNVYKFKKSKNIEALLSAACLHDVVEDTDVTYSDIATIFGASIASLVMEVTTDEDMKNALGKTKYLSIKMKNMSSWALVIKLCDILDNISDLDGCPLDFKNKCLNEKTDILVFLLQNRVLSKTHLNIVEAIVTKLLELSNVDKDRLEKINLLLRLLEKQKSKINEDNFLHHGLLRELNLQHNF